MQLPAPGCCRHLLTPPSGRRQLSQLNWWLCGTVNRLLQSPIAAGHKSPWSGLGASGTVRSGCQGSGDKVGGPLLRRKDWKKGNTCGEPREEAAAEPPPPSYFLFSCSRPWWLPAHLLRPSQLLSVLPTSPDPPESFCHSPTPHPHSKWTVLGAPSLPIRALGAWLADVAAL